MDSELLLKLFGYFPDYLSILSRALLRCCFNNLCRNSCILLCSVQSPVSYIGLFTSRQSHSEAHM